MKKHLNTLSALSLVIGLSACSSDMSDLEQFVKDTKGKFSGSVEPLPPFKPLVIYNAPPPERDPFSSLSAEVREDERANSNRPGIVGRPKEPLELFPIDSLKMVGTIEKKGEIWGLLEDSEKTLHNVRVGNYVGLNQGQITAINDSHILVTELVLDTSGLWKDKIHEILLAE